MLFFFQIVAHDLEGNYSAHTATVTVTLLDINDNAPEFGGERYVIETNLTTTGEHIGTVSNTYLLILSLHFFYFACIEVT